VFTAHTIRKDERARKIGNLIAVNQQYSDIWREIYDRPELARVLGKDADLKKQPVSDQEQFFVKMLIQHLQTVHWAMKMGVFVRIQGLQKDVREFFALPIPKAVWENIKPFQDSNFVRFIEETRAIPQP